MQLLAILAAAVVVLAGLMLARGSGLFTRPGAPARRGPARRPEPSGQRDSEFAEELAPPTRPVHEPPAHEPAYEPEYAVPSRYGDNSVVLMVRDPEWLYAYWEVQPDESQRVARRQGVDLSGSSPVLRLYDVTDGAADGRGVPFRDIVLSEYADRWFFRSMAPSREYYAEIGRITRSGMFISFARSNRVMTPPAGVSPVTSPEWPPLEWPEHRLTGAVSSPELLRKVARS